MRIENGSLVYEITSHDCSDAIAFEKMLGCDREEVARQIKGLKCVSMALLIIDEDGNYTIVDKED